MAPAAASSAAVRCAGELAESADSTKLTVADDCPPPRVVVERMSIADPSPLGLASFALTTFVMSARNAGWAPDYTWVGLGLFYGGLCQLLAGMWEMAKNNTFGATAFSTYGAFWLSLSCFQILMLAEVVPKGSIDPTAAVGWFLLAFLVFNTYMTACAAMLPKVLFLVFTLLQLTILMLVIGHFCHNAPGHGWTAAGGYVGVFTAAAAWYASAATCFNTMAGRKVVYMGKPTLTFSPIMPH